MINQTVRQSLALLLGCSISLLVFAQKGKNPSSPEPAQPLLFMKRTAKNFPKNLLGVPFKIDFKFKVPSYIDLEVNAGNGPVTISGVEGAIAFTAVKTDAKLDVTGGVVRAVIGSGSVKINIGTRSWRGVGANIQLASGELIVSSPAGFNADIDATILRSGSIDNSIRVVPLQDTTATDRAIQGRARAAGAH